MFVCSSVSCPGENSCSCRCSCCSVQDGVRQLEAQGDERIRVVTPAHWSKCFPGCISVFDSRISRCICAKWICEWGKIFLCGTISSALGCDGEGKKSVAEGTVRRRAALALLLASPAMSVAFSAHGKTKSRNPYDERRLLQQNKKIQEANRAPDDFPNFIREGEQSCP